MSHPTLLASAANKRAKITAWMLQAIPKEQAQARGLVQISRITAIRNWTCREALFDFSHQAKQAQPVLVMLDARRAALFGTPARSPDDGLAADGTA